MTDSNSTSSGQRCGLQRGQPMNKYDYRSTFMRKKLGLQNVDTSTSHTLSSYEGKFRFFHRDLCIILSMEGSVAIIVFLREHNSVSFLILVHSQC